MTNLWMREFDAHLCPWYRRRMGMSVGNLGGWDRQTPQERGLERHTDKHYAGTSHHRPESASYTPQERRQDWRPTLPRPALILDSQQNTLQAQADQWDWFLDRDSPNAVTTECCHHGSNKCNWGEGPYETVQRTERFAKWAQKPILSGLCRATETKVALPTNAYDIYQRLKYKKMPFKKQYWGMFAVRSAANEKRKVQDSRLNG